MLKRLLRAVSGREGSLSQQLLYLTVGLLTGILINALSDFFKDGNQASINVIVGICIAFLFLFLFHIRILKNSYTQLYIDKGENIPRTPHIISGLSYLNVPPVESIEEDKDKISNIRLIFNLVEKHKPALEQLHLVVSNTSGVQASKAELVKWYEQRNFDRESIKDIKIVDGTNMGEVYQKVNEYLKNLEREGIDLKKQVLIDVTAGTAAMSSGLTMAALSNGCNISYQATSHSEGGKLQGKTTWQLYKNRIIQLWESYPENGRE